MSTLICGLALTSPGFAQDNPWEEVTEAGAAEPDAEAPESGASEPEPAADEPDEPEPAEPEPEPEQEPELVQEAEPEAVAEPPLDDEPSPFLDLSRDASTGAERSHPFEVSLELGGLYNGDDAYTLFDSTRMMPSRGVRLGYRVHDRLVVVGGWHRVRRGAEVTLGTDDTDADFDNERRVFVAAYFADEFTVGPRIDVAISDILYPYALGQVMVMRGVMKLDDQPNIDTHSGQIRESGISPGLLGVAGVEVRLPDVSAPVRIALHIEAGYGWLGRASYGDFGRMKPGGFAIRSGLGLRF